jgi:hypothetical protein
MMLIDRRHPAENRDLGGEKSQVVTAALAVKKLLLSGL